MTNNKVFGRKPIWSRRRKSSIIKAPFESAHKLDGNLLEKNEFSWQNTAALFANVCFSIGFFAITGLLSQHQTGRKDITKISRKGWAIKKVDRPNLICGPYCGQPCSIFCIKADFYTLCHSQSFLHFLSVHKIACCLTTVVWFVSYSAHLRFSFFLSCCRQILILTAALSGKCC